MKSTNCVKLSRNEQLKLAIEQKIQELEQEFQQNQGLILTENDLGCLLYHKLMEIDTIPKRTATEDAGIYASAIHTEISWYDENSRLAIKPDITILEAEKLSILHEYGTKLRLPTKQYSFSGSAVIIELKFVRNKNGIRRATLEGRNSFVKDFNKVQRLFDRLDAQDASDSVFCYFVIFNKTDRRCKEFDAFLQAKRESFRHKIIYASGKVKFTD